MNIELNYFMALIKKSKMKLIKVGASNITTDYFARALAPRKLADLFNWAKEIYRY